MHQSLWKPCNLITQIVTLNIVIRRCCCLITYWCSSYEWKNIRYNFDCLYYVSKYSVQSSMTEWVKWVDHRKPGPFLLSKLPTKPSTNQKSGQVDIDQLEKTFVITHNALRGTIVVVSILMVLWNGISKILNHEFPRY